MKENNSYCRLNAIYRGIKTRCYNPRRKEYKHYGGRGITVCDEWRDSDHKTHKGWNAFKIWALENGYTDEMTIDRIDNNKGYSPENCRWVTNKTQANNKRNNHRITFKGETKTLSQWAEISGINSKTLKDRIGKSNMPLEKAFVKKDYHSKMITYKGREQSLKKWCDELGLIYSKTHSRINKYHWTIEEAFEVKGNSTARMITYKGKTQSISDWCKELDLNYSRIIGRLDNAKWSVEKAFETK